MSDKSSIKKKKLTFKQLDIISTAIVSIALTIILVVLVLSKMSMAITFLLLFVSDAIIIAGFMLIYIKFIEPRK